MEAGRPAGATGWKSRPLLLSLVKLSGRWYHLYQ